MKTNDSDTFMIVDFYDRMRKDYCNKRCSDKILDENNEWNGYWYSSQDDILYRWNIVPVDVMRSKYGISRMAVSDIIPYARWVIVDENKYFIFKMTYLLGQ